MNTLNRTYEWKQLTDTAHERTTNDILLDSHLTTQIETADDVAGVATLILQCWASAHGVRAMNPEVLSNDPDWHHDCPSVVGKI